MSGRRVRLVVAGAVLAAALGLPLVTASAAAAAPAASASQVAMATGAAVRPFVDWCEMLRVCPPQR